MVIFKCDRNIPHDAFRHCGGTVMEIPDPCKRNHKKIFLADNNRRNNMRGFGYWIDVIDVSAIYILCFPVIANVATQSGYINSAQTKTCHPATVRGVASAKTDDRGMTGE